MINSPLWRRLAAPALLSLSLLAPIAAPPAAAATPSPATARPAMRRDLPEPPPADVARKELNELTVAALHPMTGFRHRDVLAAERKERARVRSEKGIRWGGRPLASAA